MEQSFDKHSEAAAGAAIVEKYKTTELKSFAQPETEGDDAEKLVGTVFVVPDGMMLVSTKPLLDELRTRPQRKSGTATMFSIASFIEHVNRFKDEESVVFADPGKSEDGLDRKVSMTAVLDYNEAGAGKPRFGKHRTVYNFPVSEEWKAWTDVDGKRLDQATFARFLEDRLADVTDPDALSEDGTTKTFAKQMGVELASAGRLLELSRGLKVHVNQRVANAQNLSSGELSIAWETEHTDERAAPLKVPGAFAIAIPVFTLDTLFTVPVRLRYEVDGPRISWRFAIYRMRETFDEAFKRATVEVHEKTQLPVFLGAPEV